MQRKWQFILMAVAMLIGGIWTAQPAKAAGITIDGNVTDWNSVSKVTTSSKAQVALVVKNKTLYFYVATNPDGLERSNKTNYEVSNTFNLNQAYHLKVGDQTYRLTPQDSHNRYTAPTKVGEKSPVQLNVYGESGAYNNNGQASGYVTAVKNASKQGYQQVFEGSIALSDFQLKDGQNKFALSGGGYGLGTYSATTTGTTGDEASESSSTTSSSDSSATANSDGSIKKGDAGSNYNGHPDIVIDGEFDDWADVHKTLIRSGSDDYNVKEGALVQYGGNLYIYINMSPNRGSGYKELQPYGYKLKIGSKTYDLTVENQDGKTYTKLTHTQQSKPITMGIYDGKDNKWTATPTGVVGQATRKETATGGVNDIFEIKLPLKAFGNAADDGQTITLKNVNLGDQTLTVTGGSTGPILLASSGLGIALFGLWQFNRRKRRRGESL